MKKKSLFILIMSIGLNLSAQQDSINKAFENKLIAINDSLNKIKTQLTQLDTSIQPLKDTLNKIVNGQLIVDYSQLDSAQKFPKQILYKTYFFDKQHKKTTGEWALFFVTLLVIILMWTTAILYAKNDSLLKDICFDKEGKQMKSQYSPFSYSRSQLLWWTLIVLSCYILFFGITSVLIPLNVTSVLLLGFGALVYASGKLIDNAQIDKGRGDRNQDQGAQNKEEPKFFKDILSDDNGISIHRFQAVVFNIVFGIGYIAFFIKSLSHNNLKYPLIDFTDWQFALIGISSATYLGLKVSENKDARSSDAAKQNANQATAILDSSLKGDPQSAINANKETLLKKHPMMKKLIASYYFDGTKRLPCVDICISGNAKGTLPNFLEYKQVDGSIMRIKTRVITNYNNVKPQVGRGHFIANDNTRAFLGTACCILEGDDPERRYLLTCNHVMTAGNFEDTSKPKQKAVRFFSDNEFDEVGAWEFGKMNDTVDAAIIDIEKTERIEPNDIDSTIYNVTEDDCSQTEVELKGAFSKTKRAFIIHIDQPIDVDYKNETVTMNGLVTLSVDLDHFNFTPPTRKGDSGALVYHAHSRQPIGMVIGANTQFTFVVPILTVLNAFPELKLKLLNT